MTKTPLINREQETFSKFGKSFQEKLVKAILFDRPFANQMTEVLDTQYLELKYLQAFTQLIFDYKSKYEVHPTISIMASVIRTEMEDYSEIIQKQVRDLLVRIKTEDVDNEDIGYVKEKALDFCRKQKLKEAILKSVNLLQSSSFEQISKVINEAMLLGEDNNFGHEYVEDFEERYEKVIRGPITTGWQEIDEVTRGGLGKRELGVVIASTGSGKSMAMVHLGSRALVTGKTVVHYTLELADKVVAQRYDSCITGVNLGRLHEGKDQIKEKILQVEGQLIVKEYPTKSASVKTIETHLERLRQRGINPDMIIVDYADLLRPERNGFSNQELRHGLEGIYESLRGLAQKQDCPLWTCSQTNRSGINAEVITMESISEAFNKCFVADFICSIARTKEDKVENTGKMFIAKNRNGIDGVVFPMSIDLSKVYMHVLPQDDDSMNFGKTKLTTKKEQETHLKSKYKKFLSEKRGQKGGSTEGKAPPTEETAAEPEDQSLKIEDIGKASFRDSLRSLKKRLEEEGKVPSSVE